MPDVRLRVNGREYGGWQSVRFTRGITAIAWSFALSVSERWGGQDTPWPIVEEDACELVIDGRTELSGYVDSRTHTIDADSHELEVSGRDAKGALVDCSAVLSQQQFASIGVLELCQKVAAPFGITVTLQDGLSDAAISTGGGSKSRKTHGASPNGVGSAGTASSMRIGRPNVASHINPGDSPFDVIDNACRKVGLLAVSDGATGLVLTRSGGMRAPMLLVLDGSSQANVLSASARFDATKRYRRYIVSGQQAGSPETFGAEAASVKAEATDLNTRRAERVLLVRPEGTVTLAFARQRAAWESSVRAARAIDVDVTVQGWGGPVGLWSINALVTVRIPPLGIDGDMLIAEATHVLSDGGTTTTLSLARPNAFTPEPVIPTTANGGDASFRGLL